MQVLETIHKRRHKPILVKEHLTGTKTDDKLPSFKS